VYSLRSYGNMIADKGRTGPYVEALRRAVKPGSVVVDIGTGAGVLAFMACRFGARRVHAIEPSDAIEVARDIAAANGMADRIEFHQRMSTEVEIPERADVVVAEIHGILPIFQRYLPTLADARERFLAPGGTMIPLRDTVWAAVVEAPDLHESLTAPWGESMGVDMRAARRLITNDMYRADFAASQLLTEPAHCATFDHDRSHRPDVSCPLSWRAIRDGTGHGFAAWFDAQVCEGLVISNAPGKPPLIFGNAYFPWPEPVSLRAGDTIEIDVQAKLLDQAYLWQWSTRVHRPGGRRASFAQSQFAGTVLVPERLRRHAASYVPRLNEDGEIERFILQRMAERRSLGDISHDLCRRYPHRFTQWRDALAHVGEISVRCGD
jgi:type I protein arginine methyltransferase